MAEPELRQEQGRLLRVFRTAEAARVSAEADAEVQRKTAHARADATISEILGVADDHLATTRKSLADAQPALAAAGLVDTRDLIPVALPLGQSSANPSQCLKEASSKATLALRDLLRSVSALDAWRVQTAKRRRLLLFVAIGVIVIVTVGILLGLSVLRDARASAAWFAQATATRQAARSTQTAQAAATQQASQATQTAQAAAARVVEATRSAGLVLIPAGEFLMGYADGDRYNRPDAQPQHQVYLDAFLIDRTEVTNDMYTRCVAAGACNLPGSSSSQRRTSYSGNPEYDQYPVIGVAWDDARSFCQWVGGRLPTEAEWEKAARGTDGRLFPWGNELPDAQRANFSQNVDETTPVGAYPSGASPYGVLDMAGNVREWVNDWHDNDYYKVSPSSNPLGSTSGPGHYRVLRGGGWHDDADKLHTAYRDGNSPETQYPDLGFRCVALP